MIDSTNSLIGTASISAMDLRKEPGRFLDRVSYRGESFLIERAGEPKAVLVPVRDYREMKRLKQVSKDRFFGLTKELRQAFKNIKPEKIGAELEKPIKEVRVAKKSRKV